MAYTIPQYNSLNVITETPDLDSLVIEGTFKSDENTAVSITLAGTFCLGCKLVDLTTGDWYKNTGTVAIPVFTEFISA